MKINEKQKGKKGKKKKIGWRGRWSSSCDAPKTAKADG